MNVLAQRLARAIRLDGPLPISMFVTLALHAPGSGFYATRNTIGARGSFVTAPEISQMFGELLGLWLAQVWREQGRPPRARLVELGPGRGTLMSDALRALCREEEFLNSVEIVLVEASPAMEAEQRERLRGAPAEVVWVREWSDVAHDRPLFILGNEFLDTLPIRQFVKTKRGWCERMLSLDDEGALAFALAPAPAPLVVPERRGVAEAGAVYELSPATLSLARDLASAIRSRGGAALFVDYGYSDGGYGETLQAVKNHRPVRLLDDPGEADISAHVDFTAFAESAIAGGARVSGPLDQGAFLNALGIQARAADLQSAHPQHASEIASAARRLVDPAAMGTLFKVVAMAPPEAPPLPGF